MTASIREARAKLSSLLESAAKGEEVIITSHGKPKARLVAIPAPAKRGLDMDRLRRLARAASTGKVCDSTDIVSEGRER